MKYRDHRGGLQESMKTEVTVFSEKELITHLNKGYLPSDHHVEELRFEHACFDDRTGWDTYYVLKRYAGCKEFVVSGMSDGKFQPITDISKILPS